MKYCIIEIRTQTVTFRNPDFQNFHKTLSITPPTTMVGIAGAAMGLSPEKSQLFFQESEFVMGSYCKSEGLYSDLWKYNDFKERSIILKEALFQNNIILIYGSEDTSKIISLKNSFSNPVYCLTLGNSDSLAKIISIQEENETVMCNIVANCLIEGDVIEEVLSNAQNGLDFSIYSTSDPVAMDLPTRFSYSSEYGIRNVSERKQFSLVSSEMRLNVHKNGIMHKGVFIPLFAY